MPFRGENVFPQNIKTQRTVYTLTNTDISNSFAAVPVLWPSQFPDLNYTVVFGIRDLTGNAPSLNMWVEDIHDLAVTGYTAVVYIYHMTAGQKLEINSIGVGDDV